MGFPARRYEMALTCELASSKELVMKFGIIGGNGVAATNRLLDLVERKVTAQGAFRDAHHPEMIVWQATQAPSRSMFLEGRGPSWIPDYVRIACELKRLGCNVGCMCCNTAQYAVDEIAEKSGLTFINLLKEVVEAAKRTGEKTFEIFCTDGARKLDLYGKMFSSIFPSAHVAYPSEERQRLVTKVICDVKNKTRLLPKNHPEHPSSLLSRLIASASAPVILGCTDLSLADSKGFLIDSLETLADAIVRRHHPDGGA